MNLTRCTVNYGFKACFFLLLSILISSCQTTKPKVYTCTLPSGYKVESAFAQATADLTHLQCHYQFDQYVGNLLEITTSDPKEKNKEYFSNFLADAKRNGVISQRQAKQYYRRYFSPDFVSLGTMHNNCTTTCRHQVEIVKKMKLELHDKELGLLKVVGDKASYAQADQEFNQLLILIDATCLACQASK